MQQRAINKILFRVDAGKKYGYGHISRCLTLAQSFYDKGNSVFFLIRSDDYNAIEPTLTSLEFLKENYAFVPEDLSESEDSDLIIRKYETGYSLLFLDHYAHNKAYQVKLKNAGVKWVQFDYKKEERILANVVINTNPIASKEDYKDLVSAKTILCVGKEYAIINKAIKQTIPEHRKSHILIAFGAGVYPREVVSLISKITKESGFVYHIVSKDASLVDSISPSKNVNLHLNVDKVFEVYKTCEFAIVAGGITSYELAYLNIPMLFVPYADNQISNVLAFDKTGLGIGFLNVEAFLNELSLHGLQKITARLSNLNIQNKIDGLGSDRIVSECLSII